jgi:hypothetical protein
MPRPVMDSHMIHSSNVQRTSVQCRWEVTPSKSEVSQRRYGEWSVGRLKLKVVLQTRHRLPAGVSLSPCSISSPDMMRLT